MTLHEKPLHEKLGFGLHWTNQTCKQVFKQLVHFSRP
jgi:hypothetical protein